MPQTYSQMLFHLIFATKHRAPLLQPPVQDALYDWFREAIQQQGARLVEIGGMPDHIHLLLEMKPTLAAAPLVHQIKGAASHWLGERGMKPPGERLWQRGYGIFTVSESNRQRVRRYIRNQPEHHRERSSREEFILLLRRHRIPVDPDRLDEGDD